MQVFDIILREEQWLARIIFREKSSWRKNRVETIRVSLTFTLPTGGAEATRMVQFSNKSIPAEKLPIEWFLQHNIICCVCRTVICTIDNNHIFRHPRLDVGVCRVSLPEQHAVSKKRK